MRTENLENCYANYKFINGVGKAIFVNENNEEVVAINEDETVADYCDWLETDFLENEEDVG